MPISEVVFGQVSSPNDINQVVDILQRKASQQETGKYYLRMSAYAVAANSSNYQQSLSRNTVPVSVSIDEADAAHGGSNNSFAAATGQLTANGFVVYASGAIITTTWLVGGNFTIQY